MALVGRKLGRKGGAAPMAPFALLTGWIAGHATAEAIKPFTAGLKRGTDAPQAAPLWRPAPGNASRTVLYLGLGLVGGAVLAIFLLDRSFPTTEVPLGDPALIQTLGFLALASSGLLFVRQFNLKRTARNVLIWVAAGGVLIIGFSFQNALKDLGLRLRSSLIPGYPVQTGDRELTLS